MTITPADLKMLAREGAGEDIYLCSANNISLANSSPCSGQHVKLRLVD